MSFLTPDIPKETELDVLADFDRRETPFGEYLGAKVSEGFDYTTTRMLLDEDRIAREERDEYGISSSAFWGGGNPYDPITQNEEYRAHKAKRKHLPKLSEEQWKDSEFYREGMAYDDGMTPVRAKYMAEAFDKRRYRDSLIQRSPDGLRSVAGFVAQLIGNVPDPINFIPLGGAVKEASVGVRVGSAMAEGLVATAAADAMILPDLAAQGEAVGWQDAATDIFFGGLIGGVGGWAGHALHERNVKKLKNTILARHRETQARMAEKAVNDLSSDEPVDVGPILRDTDEGRQVLREVEDLANGYDKVKADPLGGPADEIIASIEPKDIERILVERGPAVERDGRILVHTRALRDKGTTAGTGMVKVIWKHGEKSAKAVEDQVTRADVVSLPEIVRRYLPAEENGRQRVWRVPRGDGRQLVVVASKYAEDGEHRLVSLHTEKAEERNFKKKPSKSRPGAFQASGGYTREGSRPTTEARGSWTENPVHDQNINSLENRVNWDTGKADAFGPVELPEGKTGELEALGLKSDGNSPELEAVMDLMRQDALPLEDMQAIEKAMADFESTQKLEGAGLEIINCILEAAQ